MLASSSSSFSNYFYSPFRPRNDPICRTLRGVPDGVSPVGTPAIGGTKTSRSRKAVQITNSPCESQSISTRAGVLMGQSPTSLLCGGDWRSKAPPLRSCNRNYSRSTYLFAPFNANLLLISKTPVSSDIARQFQRLLNQSTIWCNGCHDHPDI